MRANWAPSSLSSPVALVQISGNTTDIFCWVRSFLYDPRKNIYMCASVTLDKKGENSPYSPQIMAMIVGHSNSGATQMALGMYWIVAVPVMQQEKFSYWSKAWETPSLWEIYLFPSVFFHITPTFKNHWWTCYSCIVRNVDLLKLLFSCWKEG